MIVGGAMPTLAAGAGTASAAKAAGLDGDDFMLLLLTELRNQNPLDPVKDREFMAQLTQVNSFLELQKMNANLQAATRSNQLTQAAVLIGKTVTYEGLNGDETGVVSGVRQAADDVVLVLGNVEVPLSYVTGVAAPAVESEAPV